MGCSFTNPRLVLDLPADHGGTVAVTMPPRLDRKALLTPTARGRPP